MYNYNDQSIFNSTIYDTWLTREYNITYGL